MRITNSTTTSAVQAMSLTTTAADVTGEASFDPGSPPDVSKMADLLSRLQALQTSDPEKFKAVMKQMSEQLSTAADGTQGREAGFLADLADRFAEAGETGDLSLVKPPDGPPPGAPPPKGAKAYEEQAGSAGQSSQRVDLAQLLQSILEGPAASAS
ncbi:MAG: hypothetical protein U0229_04655 [Anaeromyxobacter sp.]